MKLQAHFNLTYSFNQHKRILILLLTELFELLPARTLARTARAPWTPARPDGVPAPQAPECPPAGGQTSSVGKEKSLTAFK